MKRQGSIGRGGREGPHRGGREGGEDTYMSVVRVRVRARVVSPLPCIKWCY